MRSLNNRKKLLVGAISVFCIITVCAVVALTQLHQQKAKVADQLGITKETVADVRALTASDGLFNLPELGDRNTLESRIDATFMVAEMARNSNYSVATQKTKQMLYAYAQNEENYLALRLKAYVALRDFKDDRWKNWQELETQIDSLIPSEVCENDLPEYLAIAQPLALLDSDFRSRTKLVLFDPSTSEQSERLAVSTMILEYLFTNGEELREHFSHLQSEMCGWASGEASYLQQTLFAANGLIGTDKATCINSSYIRDLYGCKDSKNFVSIDGRSSSDCSLTLTYYASRLGVTK